MGVYHQIEDEELTRYKAMKTTQLSTSQESTHTPNLLTIKLEVLILNARHFQSTGRISEQ